VKSINSGGCFSSLEHQSIDTENFFSKNRRVIRILNIPLGYDIQADKFTVAAVSGPVRGNLSNQCGPHRAAESRTLDMSLSPSCPLSSLASGLAPRANSYMSMA